MPESNRRAFDRDDPQAERPLADRLAVPARLEEGRVAEDDQKGADDDDDDRRRRAGPRAEQAGADEEHIEQSEAHGQIEGLGQRPGRHAGSFELEHDGFGSDDPSHVTDRTRGDHERLRYREALMDLDRFIVRNSGAWTRLEELTARARRSGTRPLGPAEVDELVALYQRTSAQLSHARTYYEHPGLTARLTTLVAAANAAIYGSQPVS